MNSIPCSIRSGSRPVLAGTGDRSIFTPGWKRAFEPSSTSCATSNITSNVRPIGVPLANAVAAVRSAIRGWCGPVSGLPTTLAGMGQDPRNMFAVVVLRDLTASSATSITTAEAVNAWGLADQVEHGIEQYGLERPLAGGSTHTKSTALGTPTSWTTPTSRRCSRPVLWLCVCARRLSGDARASRSRIGIRTTSPENTQRDRQPAYAARLRLAAGARRPGADRDAIDEIAALAALPRRLRRRGPPPARVVQLALAGAVYPQRFRVAQRPLCRTRATPARKTRDGCGQRG